jgi:hypothetical protein
MGRATELSLLHDGGCVVTWEEAMHISNHLLPGEPGSDELAHWQAQGRRRSPSESRGASTPRPRRKSTGQR